MKSTDCYESKETTVRDGSVSSGVVWRACGSHGNLETARVFKNNNGLPRVSPFHGCIFPLIALGRAEYNRVPLSRLLPCHANFTGSKWHRKINTSPARICVSVAAHYRYAAFPQTRTYAAPRHPRKTSTPEPSDLAPLLLPANFLNFLPLRKKNSVGTRAGCSEETRGEPFGNLFPLVLARTTRSIREYSRYKMADAGEQTETKFQNIFSLVYLFSLSETVGKISVDSVVRP